MLNCNVSIINQSRRRCTPPPLALRLGSSLWPSCRLFGSVSPICLLVFSAHLDLLHSPSRRWPPGWAAELLQLLGQLMELSRMSLYRHRSCFRFGLRPCLSCSYHLNTSRMALSRPTAPLPRQFHHSQILRHPPSL